MDMISDENGKEFSEFLTMYAWDLFVMTFFVFWHLAFILVLGITEAFLIMTKVRKYMKTDYDFLT